MNRRRPLFGSSFIAPTSSFLLRLPLPDLLGLAVVALDLLLIHLVVGDLYDGDDRLVVLLPALELKHVVIDAARARRVLAADGGTRVVDRTAARLLIEEHTGFGEDRVLDALQNALFLPLLRVAPPRRLERDAEVFGEPVDVTFRHLYAFVDRAAEGRAL